MDGGQTIGEELGIDVSLPGLRSLVDEGGGFSEEANGPGGFELFRHRAEAWEHTSHAFGFIPLGARNAKSAAILYAGSIEGDSTLVGCAVKVTLDRFGVAGYPGNGAHHVLFDFYARNQTAESVEHIHFNAVYRIRDGESAGLIGFPIFVGLNVGPEGVAFKCLTVNVKNDADEAFLAFLDGDVFKQGLRLMATCQPAIAPLSQIAVAVTKAVALRSRNVPVQDFYMGLDFSSIQTRARLAEGSYVAAQVPAQPSFSWSDWVFECETGSIVGARNSEQFPFNYIVFSVSRQAA